MTEEECLRSISVAQAATSLLKADLIFRRDGVRGFIRLVLISGRKTGPRMFTLNPNAQSQINRLVATGRFEHDDQRRISVTFQPDFEPESFWDLVGVHLERIVFDNTVRRHLEKMPARSASRKSKHNLSGLLSRRAKMREQWAKDLISSCATPELKGEIQDDGLFLKTEQELDSDTPSITFRLVHRGDEVGGVVLCGKTGHVLVSGKQPRLYDEPEQVQTILRNLLNECLERLTSGEDSSSNAFTAA